MFNSLLSTTLLTLALAISTLAAEIKFGQSDALSAISSESQERLITEVKGVSTRWINAFNSGDARMAIVQYKENAVMAATSVEIYNGRVKLQPVWENLIEQSFDDVR